MSQKPWDEDPEAPKRGEPLRKHDQETERKHKNEQVWHCPECGYKPNAVGENCMNCGRDFRGRPAGPPPTQYERDPRPGLREDVSYGF